MAPLTPAPASSLAKRFVPARSTRLQYVITTSGTGQLKVAKFAHHGSGGGAPLQGAHRRLLDRRPVHHRVRKREPHLDGVGSGLGHGEQHVTQSVAHSPGDVGDQQLAPLVPRRPQDVSTASPFIGLAGPPSSLITCSASLSPRPDMVRRTSSRPGPHRLGRLDEPRQSMGRLEGGDDALGPGEQLQRIQDFGVGGGDVTSPAGFGQMGVLGPMPG